MKRILVRLSVVVALVVIIGGAIGYYCYGPLLPEKTIRLDYYRGWVAAWRAAAGGYYAYSFDRYLVQGLPEHALRQDGINEVAVPSEIGCPPSYVAGFDSCMAARLKKRLACDFPEAYVQEYLKSGLLDLTCDQPSECPVHQCVMLVKEIPFKVVFPCTIARPKAPWEIAAEAAFPFPESNVKVDGPFEARPRFTRTRVCRECTDAESRWFAEHGRPIALQE